MQVHPILHIQASWEHPFLWITPKSRGHWADLLLHDWYYSWAPLAHPSLTEKGLLLWLLKSGYGKPFLLSACRIQAREFFHGLYPVTSAILFSVGVQL